MGLQSWTQLSDFHFHTVNSEILLVYLESVPQIQPLLPPPTAIQGEPGRVQPTSPGSPAPHQVLHTQLESPSLVSVVPRPAFPRMHPNLQRGWKLSTSWSPCSPHSGIPTPLHTQDWLPISCHPSSPRYPQVPSLTSCRWPPSDSAPFPTSSSFVFPAFHSSGYFIYFQCVSCYWERPTLYRSPRTPV